jgi:hypothetical protein
VNEETYTISEAATALGVDAADAPLLGAQIRTGGPHSDAGGRRRYTEDDLDRLRAFVEIVRRHRAAATALLLSEIDLRG